MNIFKKIKVMLLILALSLGCCILLASCGEPETPDGCTSHVDNDGDGICDTEGCGADVPLSATADYTVNLSNYDGSPITEVVYLYVYRGDESVHMKRITESTYTFNLPRDNYTFEIDSYGEFVYDVNEAVLTKTDLTCDLVLYGATSAPQQISVKCTPHKDKDGDGKCDRCKVKDEEEGYIHAVGVCTGASLVSLDKGERTYFIFTPTESGVYKFSTPTSGCIIGNYGMPQIVQMHNISELENNSFTSTVRDGAINVGEGGTLQMVIGIDTDTADSAVILIERISDAPVEIGFTDMPIDPVAKKYTDLLNNEFVDIDITKAVTVVYSESDGYYHFGSESGPVVFIKITASGNSYLNNFEFPSFETIISTSRICANIYDGETLVRRESYNAMIEEYIKLVGSRGLVPLDKSLADAVKKAGEHMGWWSSNSIFGENRINTESAWLFACAYLNENVFGYEVAPIELMPKANVDFAISCDGESAVYMTVSPDTGKRVNISFEDCDGVTVTVDGTEYTPDADGNIEITITATATVTVMANIAGEIHFTCVEE